VACRQVDLERAVSEAKGTRVRSYCFLQTSKVDGILTIKLSRPEKRNAIDAVLHSELAMVFGDASSEPDVDVVVLAAEGRAFCVGGDLAWLNDLYGERVRIEEVARDAKRIVRGLVSIEQPVIACVKGDAIGLGATLALLCDIVVAGESARFGDPHVRAGLVAGDGGALIWPQLVGLAYARDLLLTGRLLSAAEANRIGLVSRVVPDAEVESATAVLAASLQQAPENALRWTKRLLNTYMKGNKDDLLELSLSLEAQSMMDPEFFEATSAMVEKRAPRLGRARDGSPKHLGR
jgi:enoyl-CoA hydratase